MSAVSLNHQRIFANLHRLLGAQVDGHPREIACSNLLRTAPHGPYFYPDIPVFRGKPQLEDRRQDTLPDAAVIIEILSSSTGRYGRTFKFEHYRKLASFQDFLLVARDEMKIKRRVLHEDASWEAFEMSHPQAMIGLPSIGCRFHVADAYRRSSSGQ